MIARAVILATLLLVIGVYSRRAAGAERPVERAALASLPRQIDEWTLAAEPPLDRSVLDVLAVTDYANRVYDSEIGGPVGLYVGYYASQRQGDTIHSPQNCLPGAGWLPVSSRRGFIRERDGNRPVNEYVIQKGLDRQVVLYWYEGRGRIIANEYANKLWLMIDAARLHRSNGALVRVITPARTSGDVARATDAAYRFATALLPHLSRYLP